MLLELRIGLRMFGQLDALLEMLSQLLLWQYPPGKGEEEWTHALAPCLLPEPAAMVPVWGPLLLA